MVRSKTLILFPQLQDKRIPPRNPLILSQLKLGESKRVRKLFLFKDQGGRLVPTTHYLDVSVARQNQPGSYYVEVKGHFGKDLPNSVCLTVLRQEREIIRPVWLVTNRKHKGTVGFAIMVGAEAEKVSLLLKVEGSSTIPKLLRAAIKNRIS